MVGVVRVGSRVSRVGLRSGAVSAGITHDPPPRSAVQEVRLNGGEEASEEARDEQVAGHSLEAMFSFGDAVGGEEKEHFGVAPAHFASGSPPPLA